MKCFKIYMAWVNIKHFSQLRRAVLCAKIKKKKIKIQTLMEDTASSCSDTISRSAERARVSKRATVLVQYIWNWLNLVGILFWIHCFYFSMYLISYFYFSHKWNFVCSFDIAYDVPFLGVLYYPVLEKFLSVTSVETIKRM